MLRPGVLCIVALVPLVLLPARARGDEPARPPARVALDFHLRNATPQVHLDEELPDLDEVLHPEASYLSDVPPAPPEQVPRWYGKTLLVADPASFGLLLTGERRGNDVLVAIGITGMVLTSPLVHGSYGHIERGMMGLLMRLGASMIGAAAGGAIGGETGVTVGAATGYLGAVAFDGMYFCNDFVDEQEEDSPGLAPDVSIADSGASVGLRGTF